MEQIFHTKADVEAAFRIEEREERDKRMRLIEEMGLEDGSYPTYVSGFYRDTFVTIMYDSDPYCPLGEWDQTATAVGTWGRWKSQNFGNNHELDGARKHAEGWRTDEMIDYMSRFVRTILKGISVTIDLQDHGYMLFYTGEEIDDWFGGDRLIAYRSILGDRSVFRSWAEGEVFGHIVTGEDFDESCWGYYGDPAYCLTEAKSDADQFSDRIDEDRREAAENEAGEIEEGVIV